MGTQWYNAGIGIWRRVLLYKLLAIAHSKWLAIILSSMLFGLFHIFNGNLIQVIMTAIIGLILCMFRDKIKGCTLLSLIVAHGLYDAMICAVGFNLMSFGRSGRIRLHIGRVRHT